MKQVPKIIVGAFCAFCPLLINNGLFGADFTIGKTGAAGLSSQLEISAMSPAQTSIALRSPDIRITDDYSGFEVLQAFTLDGESAIPVEGSPAVPQVFRFYRIPDTGGAELVVTESDYDIVENINPLPYLMDSAGGRIAVKDPEVYRRNEWYPPHVAVMSAPMIMRDFRVVGVTLYPVQVNPVTRQAKIYRNLAVDLVANAEPGENEFTHPHRPTAEWAALYRDNIANLDDRALDDVTRTPGSILILCNPNASARPWADSLFVWKTRKGYKVTIDSRGSWSVSSAVTAIRNAYAASDPPLEYVILMGDPGTGWGIPTDDVDYDHAYALGNAGDDLEDIAVGRLSGSSGSAMATIHAKIMQYERTPHMETTGGVADTNWFHKAFLYAGVSRQCAGNYLLMRWGRDQFMRHTGIDSVSLISHSTDVVNPTIVIQQLGSGVGYFLWRGTWIGDMPSTLPDAVNPGGRLPITMTIECSTGDFQWSGVSCVSEAFLCAGTPTNPRGGVCGLGMATAASYNPVNVTLTGGFIYNIANLGVEHLGTAVVGAKQQLYRAYGLGGDYHFTETHTRWLNLMGDPSLAVWTDVPEQFSISHPPSIYMGNRMMEVTALQLHGETPVADALVVLWKRGLDSTWVSGLTNADGQVLLPIHVNQTGDMFITVTKRNYQPYLYTIPCVQPISYPMVASWGLDDDNSGGTQGNGNGVLNPGEIVDLPVYIRNFGLEDTVRNISAILNSPDLRLGILQATASYPNIPPGDSALGSVPFRIQAASTLQNQTQTLLTLTINSANGQTTGPLPLTCRAGELSNVRRYFTDEFGPGGFVNIIAVLQNIGTQNLSGVTAHLESLCPWVSVPEADATFGDITVGALDSNTTEQFRLHASPQVYPGLFADMRLVMTADEGAIDTMEFPVMVGVCTESDPTGPDGYGYYAYDDTDTGYAYHGVYDYLDISAAGGVNLNLNDPGDKTTPLPIYSTACRLPFGFKFYGQVYDSITICSNGWCAFGDQSYLDMFRNYPIPGLGAPDAMIAPYWDDLATMGTTRGVWVASDTISHCYIIQWKGGVGMNYTTDVDFEVILFDTTYFPTDDGNGKILVQYNQIVMNVPNQFYDETPGSTIGIQAPDCMVGLNYAYGNSYSPGAATVQNAHAILFTTQSQLGIGAARILVSDSATTLPIPLAEITIDNFDSVRITGNDGSVIANLLPAGVHVVHVRAHRYNEHNADFTVVTDSTAIIQVRLAHPQMSLPADTLRFTLGAQTLDTTFLVSNLGNGPLDCQLHWNPDDLDSLQLGDFLDSINIGGIVGGRTVQGCEYASGRWWISAGGLTGQPNLLYRLDPHGMLLDSLVQPSTTTAGWTDLAFDGHFMYGSDGADIIGLDMNGVERTRITSRLNPTKALAYDPGTDHFWVANENSSILELDRGGTIVRSIGRTSNDSMAISGLGWYADDGNDLYVYGRHTGIARNRIARVNPVTREWQVVLESLGQPGDIAGGCTVTDGWDHLQIVFAGIVRNADGGRLDMYRVAINPAILEINPLTLTIPAGSSRPVSLSLVPTLLHPAWYRFNFYFQSVIEDTTMSLPVSIHILDLPIGETNRPAIPQNFVLHQNFPNPFNPSTEICYDLPEAVQVQLKVFNTLGQNILTLIDRLQEAGSYRATWDGKDSYGQPVANGMYFYQIHAGDFTSTKKMLLLK
jgi:hypothetical protein